MVRTLSLAVAGMIVGLAIGCGGSNDQAVVDMTAKNALEDVGQMLKSLADEGRKPPTRAAELEAVEPMMPVGGPAIRNGELVYVWGSAYASGSNKVVAYEKKAPTEGGLVLLQDGTVKSMTADEFKAAPKASK